MMVLLCPCTSSNAVRRLLHAPPTRRIVVGERSSLLTAFELVHGHKRTIIHPSHAHLLIHSHFMAVTSNLPAKYPRMRTTVRIYRTTACSTFFGRFDIRWKYNQQQQQQRRSKNTTYHF